MARRVATVSGFVLCVLALLAMLGCTIGPNDSFHEGKLKPPLERWTTGNWALASLGFVLGLVLAPLWFIGAAFHK